MSKKIKTIIVDDERLARQELRYMLGSFSDIDIIDEAENVDDAFEKITSQQPDLIFLDIAMPEKDGFALLQLLEQVPKVVFVTAYDEFAIKAFEEDAVDYLLKPTKPERLAKTIDKLRYEIQLERDQADSANPKKSMISPQKKIFLKDGDKCYFVRLTDVYMIESVGNYSKFFFGTNRPMIHKSLSRLQERLDPMVFFRANRQQIINVEYISEIDSYYKGGMKVHLTTGHELEISNRNAVAFKEMMGI
jgi:two-component system, LytTR family, response regulator